MAQYVGDYGLQFGLALVALTAATAAWVISRRRYVNAAEFKRGIDSLRFEFRRSIDEARAATTRKATAVSDNLLSHIKPIDSSVTDLNLRLTRLEEHADAIDAFMAGPQKQALEENQQIGARLMKLEQRLPALTNQFSFLEQTIDRASQRDQEINSRLINTQKQMDELFPRLELGEKARTDLGSLVSLFVKQLKRVNMNSAETALRVAELETLRSKVIGLEERLGSTLDGENYRSAGNSIPGVSAEIGDAVPKGDGAAAPETNTGSENARIVEGQPTLTDNPLVVVSA